jgi:hypothetical protein
VEGVLFVLKFGSFAYIRRRGVNGMYVIGRISKRMKRIFILVAILTTILVALDMVGFGEKALTASVTLQEDSDTARCDFLAKYGWQVTTVPKEVQEVTIPSQFNEVYEQYNDLQQSQGFDLRGYQGKNVKRYTYLIHNYPQDVGEVYANVLVYGDKVIGGDVCTARLDGFMHGFEMDSAGETTPTFYETVTP